MRAQDISGPYRYRQDPPRNGDRARPFFCRAIGLLWLLALLAGGGRAWAAEPDRTLAELQHVAFSIAQGAPADIHALGQARNGDLWLGTGIGLFRFDGLRFEPFRAIGAEQLRSDMIYSMFVSRSGSVWIGYYSGGASVIRDGRVRNFRSGLPPGPLKQFAEDAQGRIWAITVGGVAYFERGGWHAIAPHWNAGDGTPYTMIVARDGTLWIATNKALVFIRAGTNRVERTSEPVYEAWTLAQAPDGRLWLSDEARGTRPILPHPADTLPPRGKPSGAAWHTLVARRILFHPDGTLWASLQRQPGIIRIAHPERIAAGRSLRDGDVTDRLSAKEGLTSDLASPMLADLQGNVWVGSRLGLDLFRKSNFVTRPEISRIPRSGYRALATADGPIFLADDDSLYRYDADERLAGKIANIPIPRGLCRGASGDVLLASDAGLARVGQRAIDPIVLPPDLRNAAILSCQITPAGSIWILVRGKGVFRRAAGAWDRIAVQPTAGLSPRVMLVDAKDRLWLDEEGGALKRIAGNATRRFGAADGLAIGVAQVAFAKPDYLLFGGELGLARYQDGAFRTLSRQDYPWLSLVTGIAEDALGYIWISGDRGVVRVRKADLDARFADRRARLPFTAFDFRDGLPGYTQQSCCANTIVRTRAGHLWFLTNQGVAWLDPARLLDPIFQPRPAIRMLTVNGVGHPLQGDMRLPKGYPSVRIDYTSNDLADAPRVEFRYKMDGIDTHWIDAGMRRQAFYTNLPAGDYRFHVMARSAQEDWGHDTASIAFTVPPTFWQTGWARLSGVALAILLVALIYALRWRRARALLEQRLEVRLAERERIARELHDTLLQGFQALILRFQVIAARIPRDGPWHQQMDQALDHADAVLIEGRDRVGDLRAATETGDLAQSLMATVRESHPDSTIQFDLTVEGTPRALHPIVRDEVQRIGEEAIRNAFLHSRGTMVEAILSYRRRQFRFDVRDDGIGLPAAIGATGGRAGHFGLAGMRERAQRIGGTLTVVSRQDAGTEVMLSIPGGAAYAVPGRWRFRQLLAAVTKSEQ